MPITEAEKIAAEARIITLLTGFKDNLSREQTHTLQKSMNVLGLESGTPDGIPGPITGSAIHRFLQTHPEIDADSISQNAQTAIRLHKAKNAAEQHLAPALKPKPQTTPQSSESHTGPERTQIVLDIGHGTPNSRNVIDPGATHTYLKDGTRHLARETEINGAVATKLKAILEARGYDVTFSHRETPHTLGTGEAKPFFQRTHTELKAPVFVSIHSDIRDKNAPEWKGKSIEGVKVHLHKSEQSDGKESLSERFADELQKTSPGGQKIDNETYRDYFVLKPKMHTDKQGNDHRELRALVELGAMNNSKDLDKLLSDSGQMEIANQIADSLSKVYPSKTPPAYTLPFEITSSATMPTSSTAVYKPITGPKITGR